MLKLKLFMCKVLFFLSCLLVVISFMAGWFTPIFFLGMLVGIGLMYVAGCIWRCVAIIYDNGNNGNN